MFRWALPAIFRSVWYINHGFIEIYSIEAPFAIPFHIAAELTAQV